MSTTTRKLRVLVVQGHRNTSGGDAREIARTPKVANAIVAALLRAGHDAICLQNHDGRTGDWFPGSLDDVGREVMVIHSRTPIDVMLDIHFEGDAARTPGVFAIVPDGDGLRTITPYSGSDAFAANTLDVAVARAITRAIALRTGIALRQRGVVEPGVMSERGTYVGADLGWRLAMFGYTAPARARMVRLVLECGNIEADAAIIDRAEFADRLADGVVDGMHAVFGTAPEPVAAFPPFGTIGTLREPRLAMVTVDALNARQWAELDQPIHAVWGGGRQFWVRGWVIG
ncbi:MAG TPA: hypothetical protein VNZ58_07905, partial [Thermomicrobiales bacterium]|nr:hypothetical protein [Thermomicrobiales bacterium]